MRIKPVSRFRVRQFALVAFLTLAAASIVSLGPQTAFAVCLVKTLLGRQAYSVCRADDFWYVVGVSYYCIPGDGVQTQRDFNKKTKEKCKFDGPKIQTGASWAALMLQIITSALRPLDETCQAPEAVGEITINECIAGFWEQATYEQYQCLRPEGETRLAQPAKRRTRTTTPCTEKAPPTVTGAHEDDEESEKKAPSPIKEERRK